VRIPTVLISPYIEAGTVFRRPKGEVPYDHTSILATLQDWLQIPDDKRLASNRVKNAPRIGEVLARSTPRTDLPAIAMSGRAPAKPTTRLFAWNDLQSAMLSAQGSRYLHNLANPLKLRMLRTPPPKSK
jgi:phospholipase C